MILHLIETGGPGGAEQMLLRLCDEYKRKGYSQLVCLRKEGWLAEEVRKRSLPLEIRPLQRKLDFSWLKELRQIIKHFEITSIHSHEFTMNIHGAILGKWLKIPSVATVHGKVYYNKKWNRRLAYRFISRLTNMVAVSKDIKNYLISICKISPERVSVIPNGINIDFFRFNKEKRDIIRSQLKINDDQILLGTIGSYYPIKGHKFLIDALPGLILKYPNIRLVMAGQGPLEKDLQAQINKNGLRDYVKIIGYVEDIPSLLSALDVFTMPSLSEGHPLALLEAAANGRSIVATNVGGISEIIKNTESGILVPPGDANALTEALSYLLSDPKIRITIANNAATVVNESWSINNTSERYLALLYPQEKK
jgi:glycosyltransferase involved in cell wall biosynthesis